MSNTIIILSGGFDPVHKGHIRMFEAAKSFPSRVVVGLNSDDWLRKKKGEPFMAWEERKEILDSIKYIDCVYRFDDSDGSACDLIRIVKKENLDVDDIKIYFGNGGDRTSANSPEVDYCSKNAIDVLWGLGGEKVQSSSDLIKSFKEIDK